MDNYLDNDLSYLDEIDAENNHFNHIYPGLNSVNSCKYYSFDEFNETFINEENDFSLLTLNARSLFPKLDQLNHLLCSLNSNFDLLCFTETWLSNATKSLCNFVHYTSFHTVRNGKNGGGVAIYCSNKHTAKRLNQFSCCEPYIETVFIEIISNNKRIVIGNIYRPPNSNVTSFITSLEQILMSVKMSYKESIILTGDFNINLFENENGTHANLFLNSMQSLSLIPLITNPTRITDNSSTLIDNIFMNSPNDVTAGLIISDISDHMPIFIKQCNVFNNANNNFPETISYRVINDENLNKMETYLYNYDFTDIMNADCSSAIDNLSLLLDDVYTMSCALKCKSLTNKQKLKPWISGIVASNIKKRNRYFILYKQGQISREMYVNLRNYVTNQIRVKKSEYLNNKFDNFKNNIKKTWQLINNFIKPNTKSNRTISELLHNNQTIKNSSEIANTFNEYFSNIGNSITNSIVSTNSHLFYMNNINITNSIFLTSTNEYEISRIILNLKNTSVNIHHCPVKLIKRFHQILSPILVHIINKSLNTGIFPSSLKLARVIPLPKDGDLKLVSNYRPISILPTFSKIFEKVVYKRLYSFLDRHSAMTSSQYGFRSGKSTTLAILKHLDYVYDNIDKGNLVFSIFLDFRKAFDCVDHNILLSKLNIYGVRGIALDWFKSYLTNRKQYVQINDIKSKCCSISCGVPQGSILGPLLFLIFINDITYSSNKFKYILYADDSTLTMPINKSNAGSELITINNELNNIYKWLCANKICLNADKTKYMVFSYGPNALNSAIKIGEHYIIKAKTIKFLGIQIDENLSFKSHTEYI